MARSSFLEPLAAAHGRPLLLRNESSGAVIALSAEPALDSRSRRRGLLGRDSLSPESALIIAPCNAIHTFGMRFPLDILFVSRTGVVVKRVVSLPRRRIAAALRAFAVIECCADHPAIAATQVGDTLRLEEPKT